MHAPIDAYGWDEHLRDIEIRFPYCFDPLPDGYPFYRPVLRSHRIDGPFSVKGLEVTPFEQDHGYMRTVGYRFGRFAYSTDVVRLDERAFDALAGVDTWMVDCGRIEPPHPVHAHLALTLEWIERVQPRLSSHTLANALRRTGDAAGVRVDGGASNGGNTGGVVECPEAGATTHPPLESPLQAVFEVIAEPDGAFRLALRAAADLHCACIPLREEFLERVRGEETLCRDGIHPQRRGARMLAETIYSQILR